MVRFFVEARFVEYRQELGVMETHITREGKKRIKVQFERSDFLTGIRYNRRHGITIARNEERHICRYTSSLRELQPICPFIGRITGLFQKFALCTGEWRRISGLNRTSWQ